MRASRVGNAARSGRLQDGSCGLAATHCRLLEYDQAWKGREVARLRGESYGRSVSASTLKREKIVDTIVLAMTNSKLRGIADEAALRSLIDDLFEDMVGSGSLDLQVLWDALQDLPDFNWDGGVPPVCLIKQREDRFGIKVVMPAHMDNVSAEEIAKRAGECTIPSAEPAKQKSAQRAEFVPGVAAPTSGLQGFIHRKDVIIGMLVVAVLAFGFVGYTLFSHFSTGSWDSFSAGDIEGGIPIGSAEKLGRQVGITLPDDQWLTLSDAVRRGQLETALRSLQAQDIEVVFVRDSQGRQRASAQWAGASITTRFRE